jgi:hypothetical protein
MRDGAVGAVASADIPEDHERGRAVLPALADVRTVGLLTHRVKVQLPHQLFEPEVVGTSRCPNLQPSGLALGQRFDTVTPDDLIKSLAHRVR